jgi:uncharacterized protein (TIGR02301 family)
MTLVGQMACLPCFSSTFAAVLLAAALSAAPGPAAAQTSDPPYESQLLRLSEILGALHYLRPLCGADEDQLWRQQMEELIAAEEPNDRRRARLTDRFNLGYSSFASVYRTCTQAAVAAVDRYQREGVKITRDITARYGR